MDNITYKMGLVAATYTNRCLVVAKADYTEHLCAWRTVVSERPVVGDCVEFVEAMQHTLGSIVRVLPRSSTLRRRKLRGKSNPRVHPRTKSADTKVLAANVTQVVIVASAPVAAFRPGLVLRLWLACLQEGLKTLLCINKCDLECQPHTLRAAQALCANTSQLPMLVVSSRQPHSLAPLKKHLLGEISILVGHSGVGKTSLLNALTQKNMSVGSTHGLGAKGRHTTTTTRLIPLEGGAMVIDSPGVREFGLHGIAREELAVLHPVLAPWASNCQFRNCLHQQEPSCAVRHALEEGHLAKKVYEGYLRLLEEV